MEIRIAHLYPDLLNMYGDRGNLLALSFRAKARGIKVHIIPVNLGSDFVPADCDFLFMGGGQDQEQNLLRGDFLQLKGPRVRDAVENGLPGLCICGGYQLMGKYYQLGSGSSIEGLGLFPIHTEVRGKRLIGDLYCRCAFLSEEGNDSVLIGFENHGGKTFLDDNAVPFASVLKGSGNNGKDGTEGCIYKQLYGTYMHGSLLPKNPALTDYLLERILIRKYSQFEKLETLSNEYERAARETMLRRLT